MRHFHDLDPEEFRNAVVFLDIDGTLVADGEERLAPKEAHTLARLTKSAMVYLISNKGYSRTPDIARENGAEAIVTNIRKPSARIIEGVAIPRKLRVVIGDTMMTDGWFARNIGARFVKVHRLTSGKESLFDAIFYAIDAVVWTAASLVSRVIHSAPWAYLELARPRQWVKNLLILVPLFFAGAFFDPSLFMTAVIGMIAFSASASVGYIVNDAIDREEDAKHPEKNRRPIASGRVRVHHAIVFAALMAAIALTAASQAPDIIPWVIGYLVLTHLYSFYFKRLPVLELVVVPGFYVLRILAGGAVVGIPVAGWPVLTILFAMFFVTVGKRYVELVAGGPRSVLKSYSKDFLKALPPIGAALTILAYALYTVIGPHPLFLYSNFFVIFGVLWYLRSVYHEKALDPEVKLWGDIVLLLDVALWGLYLLVVLYGPMLATLFGITAL